MPREFVPSQEQKSAMSAAESAVQDDPTDFEHYIELGMLYFYADRLDEAKTAFQRALELNPNAARAYNGIGRVCYHTGPPEKAIQAYQRAFALDPHYVDAYFGLAILYSAQLGDYDAAAEALQLGLEHNPGEGFLVASLGNTYGRMGRIDEAIASLQQAIRLQPDSAYAYSNLSIMYLYQKRYHDVIAACQHEIEIRRIHSARRLLGYAYDRLGRRQAAMAELERSVTLNPEDYEARAALAKVYRTAGRQQDADEQYALAREMARQDDEYGQACFEAVSGKVEQALSLLQVGLAKGQVQAGWARIDPEFAFIKDDPRFRALIGD